MKYLKRFDEELKTQTYQSAAAGLNRLGHTKRANDLNVWSEVSRENEANRKMSAMIDMYSKHGVFSIDLGSKHGGVLGNFYLFLDFDSYQNDENWGYWEEDGRFDGNNLWMTLDICLIPADEETFEECSNKLDYSKDTPYYASSLGIKISDPVGVEKGGTERDEDLPYGSGQWELTLNSPGKVSYIEGNEYDVQFVNRAEAMKFRKLVIDIFEGNVEMGVTSENPGGVKEKIIDYYCNKKGVSIEEFDNVVDSIKKITVNSFYKD
jgi:hypothetical protein